MSAEKKERGTIHQEEKQLKKWFSSLHLAKKAIADNEDVTSTKFIRPNRRSFDVAKSRILFEKWEEFYPYAKIKQTTFECQHGVDYNKAYNDKRAQKKDSVYPKMSPKKKYHCVYESKKKNCNAKLHLVEVLVFPKYKVQSFMKQSQKDISSILRYDLICVPEQVEKKTMWLVILPSESAHTGHALTNRSTSPDDDQTRYPLQESSKERSLNVHPKPASIEINVVADVLTDENEQPSRRTFERIDSVLDEIRDIAQDVKSNVAALNAEAQLRCVRDELLQYCPRGVVMKRRSAPLTLKSKHKRPTHSELSRDELSW